MLTVLDHGVVPDGQTLNTASLQALIDRCGEAGGGTILFPPGRYLTGGLVLRSHVALHLENGAFLLGSTNLDHYTHYNPVPEPFFESREGLRALLFALDCTSIRVTGEGTIDGQGPHFSGTGIRAGLPRNIWFARCHDVIVEGLHLRCSPFWMQHYLCCTKVRLTDLDVWNHGSSNGDGIDIDSCRDVQIRGCRVDSSDDAICLKSGNLNVTENVLIADCLTRTHCNHFKTGTESNGGFRNIIVDGMVMTPSERRESHHGTEGADWRGACGIALGAVDGGCLENITVQNVTMDQVRVPFFIRLGHRSRPVGGTDVRQPVSFARNITIRQVNAREAAPQSCYIAGLPDAPVRDVTIADCRLDFEGGGAPELIHREVPMNREGYPSMEIFGELPAYAIFARDVDGLHLRDLTLSTRRPEPRPALAWNSVRCLVIDRVSST